MAGMDKAGEATRLNGQIFDFTHTPKHYRHFPSLYSPAHIIPKQAIKQYLIVDVFFAGLLF